MTDKEGFQRTFNHMMELYVNLEVTQRKNRGVLPDKFVLHAAQILFKDDGGRPLVRLNEETKIIAKAKLKSGIKKDEGEFIDLNNEIEKINSLTLMDDEESKYAHITTFRFGDRWLLGFDFRYNKGLARTHFEVAKQFFEVANISYEKELTRPFIDNLFSCVELLAKCELLLMPNKKFKEKASHGGIQMKYNQFVNIGNAKSNFKTALNKLSSLRDSARYLRSNLRLSETESEKYLLIAKEMFDWVESRLIRH
jgi:uncharacterized protein (UPF0332 family)